MASRCSTTRTARRPVRHGPLASAASLKHAPPLAFTNPTVNSTTVWSRSRPRLQPTPRATARRFQVRDPDHRLQRQAHRDPVRPVGEPRPGCAFQALLASADGIKNKIEPTAPIDKDIWPSSRRRGAEIDQVPTSSTPSRRGRGQRRLPDCGQRLRPDRDVDRFMLPTDRPAAVPTRTSSSSTTTSKTP